MSLLGKRVQRKSQNGKSAEYRTLASLFIADIPQEWIGIQVTPVLTDRCVQNILHLDILFNNY